jgi:hypothetical protein
MKQMRMKIAVPVLYSGSMQQCCSQAQVRNVCLCKRTKPTDSNTYQALKARLNSKPTSEHHNCRSSSGSVNKHKPCNLKNAAEALIIGDTAFGIAHRPSKWHAVLGHMTVRAPSWSTRTTALQGWVGRLCCGSDRLTVSQAVQARAWRIDAATACYSH